MIALAAGASVQPFVGRIGAWTGQRQLLVGIGVIFIGILLCALEAALLSPALAIVVAIVLGLGYGVSVVAGLAEVQQMANPDQLAGLTGVYCSITYAGFLLPAVLASLAAALSYVVLLAIVASACLISFLLIGWNLRDRSGESPLILLEAG